MLGMHGTVAANFAVNEADLLLAFGARFDDRVTGKLEAFAANARIVHIDIDPAEIDKNKDAHVPVCSDIKPALQGLNRLLAEQPIDQSKVGAWAARLRVLRAVSLTACAVCGVVGGRRDGPASETSLQDGLCLVACLLYLRGEQSATMERLLLGCSACLACTPAQPVQLASLPPVAHHPLPHLLPCPHPRRSTPTGWRR
jgi:hypothetical protein